VCEQLHYSYSVNTRVLLWGRVFHFLYSAWTHSYPKEPTLNSVDILLWSVIELLFLIISFTMGRHGSVGIATLYELDCLEIESRWGWGARFSAPVQTCPGAHPASYTMGTGSFLGVKRPGRGVDHPLPSSAGVKERVELYICSTSGPSWPVIGWPLPLHIS
jgi:hypothetical protein